MQGGSNHVFHEIDGKRDATARSAGLDVAATCGAAATRLIRALAERQHGVVARRQLVEGGLGKGLIQARVRSGLLIPVHRGVYALAQGRLTRRGEWMAAVLACGPGAVLSHGSAVDLYGLRASRGMPEVTRRCGGGRARGIRIHQARILEPHEVSEVAGIPVTSLERTLLDVAARFDERQLERLLVAADRSGELRWARLERMLAKPTGKAGLGRLRGVAGRIDPRAVEARSALEVDFLTLCREAGVPAPQTNVLVAGRLVDFLWPSARVIVEVDGYRYHGDRGAFERDRQSTLELQAAGYEVQRATYRMLRERPDLVIKTLRRALGSRSK